MRWRTIPPQDTAQPCPHCGQAAPTARSPTHHRMVVDGGRWLWCGACGSHADRDDAAARTSARLGVTDLAHMQASSTAKRSVGGERVVTPVAYTGAGAGLPLPPPGRSCPPAGVRERSAPILSDPGWIKTAYLQSAQPPPTFLRLCG